MNWDVFETSLLENIIFLRHCIRKFRKLVFRCVICICCTPFVSLVAGFWFTGTRLRVRLRLGSRLWYITTVVCVTCTTAVCGATAMVCGVSQFKVLLTTHSSEMSLLQRSVKIDYTSDRCGLQEVYTSGGGRYCVVGKGWPVADVFRLQLFELVEFSSRTSVKRGDGLYI